jgi:hypothetical protein
VALNHCNRIFVWNMAHTSEKMLPFTRAKFAYEDCTKHRTWPLNDDEFNIQNTNFSVFGGKGRSPYRQVSSPKEINLNTHQFGSFIRHFTTC